MSGSRDSALDAHSNDRDTEIAFRAYWKWAHAGQPSAAGHRPAFDGRRSVNGLAHSLSSAVNSSVQDRERTEGSGTLR